MEVSAHIVTLALAETFVISRESHDTAEVVQLELAHAGVSGHGEGAPIERYGETAEYALQYIEDAADLLGDDPFALDEIEQRLEPREWAARSALDAALHDLQGKLVGVALWRLLGLRRLGPPTSWTIWLGEPDDMANRAAKVADRFLRLKLKLGARDGRDVDRVRAVRAVTEAPLQVDVNEYWTLDEALESLPQLAELGVDYCEQPLPAGDPGGARLKAESPIPVSLDVHYGKTLRGVMRYRRESVVAILDTQRAGESDDGVPIVGTVDEGMQHGPNTALVGVVTQGGHFPGDWQELLKSCVAHGLDLENGLHVRLHDIPGLPDLAREHGVALRDLREPPPDLSTATGENLGVDATIVLTVGSDCAIGKMTATCELDLEARKRGLRSVFVPTGQTGIAIAGWGIAVDAVVSDFLAGAAERLVVEGATRGDLLWVEGQAAIAAAEDETGLAADDPVRFGAGKLLEAVLNAGR